MATQKVLLGNIKGPAGKDGKDGTNATVTSTATQNANGLMSSADKKKLDTITGGAATSFVLADGSVLDIDALLKAHIATIRSALGVATTSQAGLTPQLPASPSA